MGLASHKIVPSVQILRERALTAAERGHRVFPVVADGKTPLVKRWQEVASSDAATIEKWWSRWPDASVGVATGQGLTVVDLDVKNGADGIATWAGWCAQNNVPELDGTATPSGGRHIYYQSAEELRNRAGVLRGVDTRGAGGYVVAYDTPPRLEDLPELPAAAVTLVGRQGTTPAPDDSLERAAADGLHPYTAKAIEAELARLDECDLVGWGGPPWDATTFEVACNLVELANSNWSGYSLDDAEADLLERAPTDEGFGPPEHADKWRSALSRVDGGGRPNPDSKPEDDFDGPAEDLLDVPTRLDDAHLAAWMARRGLRGQWCWAGGLGWLAWDGRRWVSRRDEDVREAIRRSVIEVNVNALHAGATADRLKTLNGLLSTGRIGALASLIRGVVSVDPGDFDQRPDLLNVGNGVVDLRTGELLLHDPDLHLTQITDTPYVRGAAHPDWTQVLSALDPEVMDWMQVRFGQAATGYPTSDDVLPVGQGGGSNGKSTLLTALFGALGDHIQQVPEKLLRASPSDHPTELMTLRGARIAVIDETPEVATLNVPRLKAMLGQEWMTARAIRRDNVTWRTTHSLFVMTNYRPTIAETDHGTWRRLALVRFTKTFPRDGAFRARVARGSDGRREAVLAWVVEGARRFYAADAIPPAPTRVEDDTRAWRGESDLILAYLDEALSFDREACVLSRDLLDDFSSWLSERGHRPWSDRTFSARFGDHEEVARRGIAKANPRAPEGLVRRPEADLRHPGDRPKVWLGVRWRTADDDA